MLTHQSYKFGHILENQFEVTLKKRWSTVPTPHISKARDLLRDSSTCSLLYEQWAQIHQKLVN